MSDREAPIKPDISQETRPTIPLWPDPGRYLGFRRDATYKAADRGQIVTIQLEEKRRAVPSDTVSPKARTNFFPWTGPMPRIRCTARAEPQARSPTTEERHFGKEMTLFETDSSCELVLVPRHDPVCASSAERDFASNSSRLLTAFLYGSIWTVQAVEAERNGFVPMRLVDDLGVQVEVYAPIDLFHADEIDAGDLMGDPFTYGYAITCHKAQGSQWGSVLVFDESFIFGDDGDRWLYLPAIDTVTVVQSW